MREGCFQALVSLDSRHVFDGKRLVEALGSEGRVNILFRPVEGLFAAFLPV